MTQEEQAARIRRYWAAKDAQLIARRDTARLQRERAKLFPEMRAALKAIITTPYDETAFHGAMAVLAKAETIEKGG